MNGEWTDRGKMNREVDMVVGIPSRREAESVALPNVVPDLETTAPLRPTLERNLGWIVLALVLGGCALTLFPFASALLWAVVLSYSSWPLYCRLAKLLGGRRNLAACLLALAMVCVILVP